MSKKILSLFFFVIIFSFHKNVFSVVKGSETAVSVEPAYTFPAADEDNAMLGFGWFKNGFSLENDATTCTFDSVYPVSGTINLNGGTLLLYQDLIFKNVTTIASLGNVIGNNHLIELCSSVNQLPSEPVELQDVVLHLNADLVLTDSITFKGNCKIIGDGWDMKLEENGYIIVESDTELHFSDVHIHGIKSYNFVMRDDSSRLVLEHSEWAQHEDYIFSKGSILFLNDVSVTGACVFHYDSKLTSTVEHYSTVIMTEGTSFKVGRKDSVDSREPLYFEDESSVLRLDSCSFIITGSGMCFTRGKIEVDRDVEFQIDGNTVDTGLMLGCGIEAEDSILHLSSGACLRFRYGQLIYNNYANNKLQALSESARIIRYGGSKMHIARDWNFPCLTLKVDSGAPITTLADGVTFFYNNAKMVFTGFEYDFKGHQSGSYYFYLDGGDYVNLSKGSFLYPLSISGAGNQIYGSGNIGGPIVLKDGDTELIFNLNGSIVTDIQLNGGTIILGGDLELGADAIFTVSGTINLADYNFSLCGLDSIWTSSLLWQNHDGGISLNSRAHLVGRWLFEDSCIINGNGHTIDMGETGQIIIKDGVCLTLRNVILHTVSQDDIQLESDDSSLVFDNVIWLQDTDILFDKGSMKFLNDVDFRGSYSFIYDSVRTSTIAANSKWKITKDMCLRIGRKEFENSPEPLYFESDSSVLRFDDCSFVVTGSGMTFSRGKVEMDRDVTLEIIGTTTSNGLILGTGTECEDIIIKAFSGASLSFTSGQLVYNNCNPDAIIALSEAGIFNRYGPSKTYIAKDWNFPQMVLKVVTGLPTTVVADGVDFNYSNVHFVFENVEFDFTGHQYYANTFCMEGNDLFYLSKGNFVLPLSISGTGNKIWGTGDISGPIILQDSDTDVSFNLNGEVWNDIALNDSALTLWGDLRLGGDFTLTGAGEVQLMRFNVILGCQDSIWTSTISWHSNGLYQCPYNFPRGIDLHSKVRLKGQWNFEDDCTIDGNGNMLCLGDDGTISIAEGARVVIRNTILNSGKNNNIYCMKDNSALILDNVTWLFDSDITFTTGSMKFENKVDFIGSYSFVYDSNQTSTISSGSRWSVSNGMCVRIGRKKEEGSVEPLYFEDSSSILKLDNCSLLVTGSGLTFSRGVVEVDRNVDLEIEGQTLTDGLILGDGTEAGNFTIRANSGVSLNFRSGQLVYNNYTDSCIVALSESARFVRYGPSKAYIARDWTFPQMVLKVASGLPTTVVADGVTFDYDNVHFIFETVEFDFTGHQYYANTFCLEGNDLFYLTKGSFVLPLSISGSGNNIWGTGDIGGTLTLQDSNAHVICNLNGEVWNNIALNDSILELSGDLHLGGDFTIDGSGQVRLMRYNVVLGSQDSVWTSTIKWHSNGVCHCPYNFPRGIDLHAETRLKGQWCFQDHCTINGHGNSLYLGEDGILSICGGTQLRIRDAVLHTSSNNFYCYDDDSSIVLDNVTWVFDSDFTFTQGSIKLENNVDFIGSSSFVYESSQTSTISSEATWSISGGMNLRVGKKEIEDSLEPFYFEDSSSILKLDNCTFIVTGSGLTLSRGIVEVHRSVNLEVLGNEMSNGFYLGDGTPDGDIIINACSGGALHFKTGLLVYNNYSNDCIRGLSGNEKFIRYGPSKSYIARDWTFPHMGLEIASGLPTAELADGVEFRYNNSHFVFLNVEFDFTGRQYTASVFHLEGDDVLYLNKGNFILPVWVSSTGNYLWGTGSMGGSITLQDSNTNLIFDFNGNISSPLYMNGGTITLGDDLSFASGYVPVGGGTINFMAKRLALGAKNITWEDSTLFYGEAGGSIDMRSRVDLVSTWTFVGDCIIDGHGNTIDLSRGGNIVLAEGAKLTFREVKIIGVSDNNIRCLDDSSVIILDDSEWVQDDMYSFSMGALMLKNSVKMEGAYEFSYETKMTSTILRDSTWKFSIGSILKYNPTINSKDLIEFYDDTSYLNFHSSYLHTNTIGMNLTKGNIIIKGESDFLSDNLVIDDELVSSEGITIGGGTASDDCVVKIALGSVLHILTGAFNYNNVSASSFIMENQVSALKIESDVEFRLYQDLDLGNGVLKFCDGAFLDLADGKNIVGSVSFVE